MIWNITIELPDDEGNKVLKSIAGRHDISISTNPTQSEIDEVSQVIALEIYQSERFRMAEEAAQAAREQVLGN